MIRIRRHVFHIAGYDPISASDQHRRFQRQLTIFEKTWNVEAVARDLESESSSPRWHITSKGPNWQVESTVELLAWDDIITQIACGGRLQRLLRSLVSLANLIWTGTLLRYAIANQRYFLFAIAPFALAVLFGIVSWSVAFLVASSLDWPLPARYVLGMAGGLCLFLSLLEWPGRQWRIYQALDDWNLALDYVYRRRRDLENRLDHFARRIVSESANGSADEIVVVGHSLGAILAVDAVARALELDHDLGRHGRSISIMTVGATIPKCALHPAAHWLRDRSKRIVIEPTIFWVEYQSRADAISFYRFDPVALKRICEKEDRRDAKPLIRRVQIKDMLQPETFKKYRHRVLRLHYQSVMASDRRGTYDYFMMICGPIAVKDWTTSRRGLLDFFSESRSATSGQAREAIP